MPQISEWLEEATKALVSVGIHSAKLDAELILSHTLKKSRTHLHAHGDEQLDARTVEIANARIDLRKDRTPIAYIIGHKEFYGRMFRVSPATLIPRPESEDMITMLKDSEPDNLPLIEEKRRLVDVGTGSGILGITAKLELPEYDVTLLDISRHALAVASNNARHLKADVEVLRSDLLQGYPFTADVILANLPYVDPNWNRSPETEHEPAIALFTEDNGLKLIKKLLPQAAQALNPGGRLFIEADKRQHTEISEVAASYGFVRTARQGFILQFRKKPKTTEDTLLV